MRNDHAIAQRLNHVDFTHSVFDSLNFSVFWELTTLNSKLWLSQVFVARFDLIGVITRYKSENNFFTSFGERWIWQLRPHATNQKNVHSVKWAGRCAHRTALRVGIASWTETTYWVVYWVHTAVQPPQSRCRQHKLSAVDAALRRAARAGELRVVPSFKMHGEIVHKSTAIFCTEFFWFQIKLLHTQ